MRWIALAVLLWTGAAHAEWQPPTPTETALIVASMLAVEADVVQTVHARMTYPGFRERNPLLGEHPSPVRIILQNGVVGGLLTAGLGYLLPSPWRSIFSCLALGTEGVVVVTNF